jgi:serine/threonine protein kinase
MSILHFRNTELFLESNSQLPYRLIEHEFLGSGGFAVVHKVQDTWSERVFARKKLAPKSSEFGTKKLEFAREIHVMKRLMASGARHMVKLFAAYCLEEQHELTLIMEPVAVGTLEAYLSTFKVANSKFKDLKPLQHFQFFGCLANALAHIHKESIRHKDIKPSNILIHDGRVLLSDFGLAIDCKGAGMTTSGIAAEMTARYSAPEVLQNKRRNAKSDVFSLGCVFFEIVQATGMLLPCKSADFRSNNIYAYATHDVGAICQEVLDRLDTDEIAIRSYMLLVTETCTSILNQQTVQPEERL